MSRKTIATTPRLLFLTEAHVQELKSHAEAEYPNECCGLLLGRGDETSTHITEVVRAENMAEGDRRRSYQVDWPTLLTIQRRARDENIAIVGFYHSHPNGSASPSERDRREAWIDHAYLIIPVADGRAGDVSVWRLPVEKGAFGPEEITVTDQAHKR